MTLDVQALSDKTEILELLARFARALDDKDWDLMRTVFTEEASGDFGLGTAFEGIDSILHACRSIMENLDCTQHFLGNDEVWLDGDRARGRHKVVGSAFLRAAVGTPTMCERGEYTVEYVRVDGDWCISSIKIIPAWIEGNMGILSAGIGALTAA
jgi:hypothetical protein